MAPKMCAAPNAAACMTITGKEAGHNLESQFNVSEEVTALTDHNSRMVCSYICVSRSSLTRCLLTLHSPCNNSGGVCQMVQRVTVYTSAVLLEAL